jgi:hypothetical protein
MTLSVQIAARATLLSTHQGDGMVVLEVGTGAGPVHCVDVAPVSKERLKVGVHLQS